MNLVDPPVACQLGLAWDTEPAVRAEHLSEWIDGSAISAGIAALALESIAGSHQVLGFLNPAKLGRNLGYATRSVQRTRQHYTKPISGGWLASGHAPLEGGRLVPVTFKPDHPRLSEKGKAIKYERPAGSRPLPYFAPLDAAAYAAIAERAGLTPPAFVSSWSAWRWLLAQAAVEVTIDEGEKKAAAGCSHGWLTIGLAGVWNGCPRPKDASGQPFGAPALIAELRWLRDARPAGAPLTIAFDASESPRGRLDIRNARRMLGRLLAAEGHAVRIREMQQPADAAGYIKGTDDLLVHGGADAMAQLKAQPFEQWLRESSQAALRDHLLQPFRTDGRRVRTVARHFKGSDVPAVAPLVALIGGMGSNKTGAVAELAQSKQPQHQLRKVVAAACDGACKGNPGPGGWGAVLQLSDGSVIELGGHAAETTNNRMELLALIELLQQLQSLDLAESLEIATDSQYVLHGFEQWLPRWKRNGWRTSTGEPVKNADLWQQLDQLRIEGISLRWVKGHAGHALNEQCDAIASAFASGETPPLRRLPTTGAVRIVSITHRRSLADNQGQRFGLPVKREGQVLLHGFDQSQDELPQDGLESFVVVADSSHIGGSSELRPDDCEGAVLFIDEADAFLRHCLTSSTHIKQHRAEVLTNLAACVASAQQVLLAGAHIDETTLAAFEAMRIGAKAHIIRSSLRPAKGRKARMLKRGEDLLARVRWLAKKRRPFIFHTGSKRAESSMAPVNLAELVRRWWPDARVLELTAETIREPGSDAAKAIENPQRLLNFDVVLASPVLETGFSIEDPQGHFCAVLGHTSGHVLPHAFVQSLGRLRTKAPRFIWCSNNGARVGNGAPVADEIERGKLEHADVLVQLQLVDAGEACGDAARFLRIWAQLAADQNWLAAHYRHAVETLLEVEGYEAKQGGTSEGCQLSDELTQVKTETIALETKAVAATPAPMPSELEQLEQRQRLTADERRTIERGQIARDFGIGLPTPEQVAASRNGSYGKLQQHLLVVDAEARQRWQQKARRDLTPSQRRFAPDVTRAMAPVTRAIAIEQLPWLLELLEIVGTGQTVTMHAYEAAHEAGKAQGGRWREVFGFDPRRGTCRTFVASLLALLGFKLERTKRRSRLIGTDSVERAYWHYTVTDELAVLNRHQVLAHIRETLQELASCHFSCK